MQRKVIRALGLVIIALFLSFLQSDVRLTATETNDGVSRWNPIGPSAGTIQQILPHRGIPNVVFAINNRHLYRSTDFGKHWRQKPLENVLQIQIHARSGRIFVLTEIPNQRRYYPSHSALWVSTNDGETFRFVSRQRFELRNIRIHPDNSDILFAWRSRLYMSIDGGENWDAIINFPQDEYEEIGYYIFDVVFSPFQRETVFVSAEAEYGHADYRDLILQSDNLGKRWRIELIRDQFRTYGAFSFLVDPLFPDRVFAHSQGRGILRLTETGWIRVSDFGVAQLISHPNQRNKLLGIRSGPSCGQKLFQSFDEGHTWKPIAVDLAHRISLLAVLQDDSNTLLGATNGGGLYRRERDSGWFCSSAGMKEAVMVSVATDRSSRRLYAIAEDYPYPGCNRNQFFYAKNALKDSWSDLTFQLPRHNLEAEIADVIVDPNDTLHLYLPSSGRHASVSFDGSKTWKEIQFDRSLNYNLSFITPDPKKSNIAYASNRDNVLKTNDGGRTFQPLPLDFKPFRPNGLVRVVIDENDSNVLYFFFSYRGVLKSLDGGLTVAAAAVDSPKNGIAMAQLPGKESFLLMESTGAIFRTTNGGRTWKQLSDLKLPSFFYSESTRLLAADRKGEHFFALINAHLNESLDGGRTWSDVTSEFPAGSEILDITDPRNKPFFVGTSKGVFQFD